MSREPAVLGIFPYLDDLLKAVAAMRERRIRIRTVYSPTPCHEIQEALGTRPSPVRYFTLFGGILGLCGGLSLATYAMLQWGFITGGKPVVPWVPFVVVGFEMTILVGFLCTLAGMLLNNRMPRIRLPQSYDPRFSEDRFGILVQCEGGQREDVRGLFVEAGAEEIHEVDG